jgi:hypothetical protein
MATSSAKLSGPARRDVLRAGVYGLGLGVVGLGRHAPARRVMVFSEFGRRVDEIVAGAGLGRNDLAKVLRFQRRHPLQPELEQTVIHRRAIGGAGLAHMRLGAPGRSFSRSASCPRNVGITSRWQRPRQK